MDAYLSLADARSPVTLVLELGGTQCAGSVARGAHGIVDFLAGFLDARRVGVERGQLGNRLDACEGGFLGGFAGDVGLVACLNAKHQLNDQENRQQRSEQTGNDGNDEFHRRGLGHLGV